MVQFLKRKQLFPQKDIAEHQLSKKLQRQYYKQLQTTANNWLKIESNRNKPIKNTLTYIGLRKEGLLTEIFSTSTEGIKGNLKVFIAKIGEDYQRHPVIYIVGYANTFLFQDKNKLDTKIKALEEETARLLYNRRKLDKFIFFLSFFLLLKNL
ncbi:hypothetical protein D0S48_18285 [Psychrobacillus sp. AK 1817]|nr:hypothetical protein D0S48_18285 [Psychrobacillus sp. AK 1817]